MGEGQGGTGAEVARALPSGVVKLAGEVNTYRIRVGDYRILYEIHDQVLIVVVLKVADRKEAYR